MKSGAKIEKPKAFVINEKVAFERRGGKMYGPSNGDPIVIVPNLLFTQEAQDVPRYKVELLLRNNERDVEKCVKMCFTC